MTAGVRALSSSSPVSTIIPSTARKVIHDLKEIINNTNVSDEEIYSVLRDCNMDPNETVQKLLNQDTFHEVKRKRDKKKENVSKEAAEIRSRVSGIGSSVRGGRSRGRGNHQSHEYTSNGRGQSISRRENGLRHNTQTEGVQEQFKASSSIISGNGLGATTHDVPNGTSPYHTIVQGSRGGWGIAPGQATMAEILKSRNALQGNVNLIATPNDSTPSEIVSQQPLYPPDEGNLPSSGDHGAESYVNSEPGGSTGSLRLDESSSFQKDLQTTSQIHDSITYDHVDFPCELTSRLEMNVQVEASSLQLESDSAELSHQSSSVIGSGLEWKPKSPGTSGHDNLETVMRSTSNLSLQEDQSVTIPDCLHNPVAERSFPTFGSFNEDYDSNVNSADKHEDNKKSGPSVEVNLPDEADHIKPSNPTSLKPLACTNDDHKFLSSAYEESLVAKEDAKSNMDASVHVPIPHTEVAKPETVVQKTGQYNIPLAMHNHCGPTPIPQIPYVDPSTNVNYFNPAFRPHTEVDARYAQFVSTNTASKLVPVVAAQAPSHEGGNSVALPIATPTAPPSTIPHQHIGPIHAYPVQQAAVPVTPFGANAFGIHYVPPSYGYIHSPYQHNYAGNTSYPQAPGSGYAYAPTIGAGAVKYALPQYKSTGASAGMASHTTGYGNNYGGSSSGFAAINSAVTSATGAGYGDVSGPQHKENNIYIPRTQHAEGSGVWLQNTATREMAPIQTNSFYNHLIGQGQHTSFSHTQTVHGVPAAATYANLYHHQSQSGSAPAAHQILSHPQVLSVGTQTGAYQPQQHRVQPNWPQNY